jgi:phosphoglycerate kinase
LVSSLLDSGNIFVNDAFGTAHRAHSSVVGIDHKWRVAGYLMKKELDFFQKVMDKPQRPFLVIIGGSKVSDKIKLINSMIEKADEIIIGGGMAYTFLKKMYNISIGKSLFDAEGYKHIDEILEKAKKKGVPMHFVTDIVCAKEFKNDTEARVYDIKTGIEDGWEGMDGGPESIKMRSEVIARAKTIMWNGPTGVIEFPQFRKSSLALLHDII